MKDSIFMKVGVTVNETQFQKELGSNIKMFRKLMHLTQRELALKINKSTACVSKYENGEIAIDAFTLQEIARALDVQTAMLFPDTPVRSKVADPFGNHPFFSGEPVFFYFYKSAKKEIITSVIQMLPGNHQVAVYFDVQDPSQYKTCKFILTGALHYSDSVISIFCNNDFLKGDFLFIGCRNADLLLPETVAFCSTLTRDYRFIASKCYLTRSPIREPQNLISILVSDKEELREIKKRHCFTV